MNDYVGGFNPTAFVFMLCMGFLLVVLPRKYALLPLFAAACYMTMGQRVQIAGLNFTIIRILTLVGWFRLVIRREFRNIRLNRIDIAVLCWAFSSIVIYSILFGTRDAFIYKCGQAYDAVGLYILFRGLVRDVPEIVRAFTALAVLIIPLAGFMVVEKITGRNVFFVFGGVSEFTIVRDGVLRCQGPFPHSILAGTFAAALVPFFMALIRMHQARFLGFAGLLSSSLIAVTSGSSGPIMTFACGLLAFGLWRWRFQMKLLRRGLLVFLGVVQLFMKVPVWFIIAHMGVFSGSTAYYRAFLIDQTIRHFSEWWLIGTQYKTAWAPMLIDITDMYVRVAFDGGLITLLLFFLILKRCYSGVGRAIRLAQNRSFKAQYCIWALGAALFAHSMTFLAVWYWDQNIVNWYFLLAVISVVAAPSFGRAKKPVSDEQVDKIFVGAPAEVVTPAYSTVHSL